MKNILLIGETGTGKSSLGNFILEEDFFIVSNEPNSCTNKIVGRRSKENENIFIIDTPGYNDTKGSDRKNFEDVLEYFNRGKKLELVLLTLNFQSARFPFGCQNFIKFLCNVFPKKFCYHFGIVFTHFDLDYQTKISKKNNSEPKAMAKKFVHEIMKLISEETKEELFLSPPVYFLDSLIKDDNSKRELNNLISFAKNLPSIDVFQKKDFFIKEEYPDYDNRSSTYETDDEIVTVTKYYERKKQIFYDGSINYTDWEYKYSNEYRKEKERVVRYEEREPCSNSNSDEGFNLGDAVGLVGLIYMAFNFIKNN